MRKYFLFLLIFSVSVLPGGYSQSSPGTLDVVSWNLEWFGSAANGPADNDLQEKNVLKVLRYLNADIYGLVEVVDTMRLRRVVDSLGSNYGFSISTFCSLAASPSDADWIPGQKLCFIYNKDFISNPSFRAFIGNNGNAYNSWASGRYPYQMNANVTNNGITKNLNFFLLHGKAGATISDYDRRKAGVDQMKDSLDTYYPTAINIILGDFNDDLDLTIVPGYGPVSSYTTLIKDSTDSDNYKSITLPESYAGVASTLHYADDIDHHVISNEAFASYIAGSAKVRQDVAAIIPGYLGDNTSDHYPVFSQYNFSLVTGVTYVNASDLKIRVFPNPSGSKTYITFGKALQNVHVSVYDITGRVIRSDEWKFVNAGESKELKLEGFSKGIYIIQLQTAVEKTSIKILVP